MYDIKILLLEGKNSHVPLLGRTVEDYQLKEWENYDHEIVDDVSIKKLMKEGAYNIILSLDMPLVLKDEIFALINEMEQKDLISFSLGSKHSAERVCKKWEDSPFFVESMSFVKVDSAKNFNIVYNVLKERITENHLLNGVMIPDNVTVFIDDTVKLEKGAVILPYSRLVGDTTVMCGATVEGAYIKDSIIEEGANVSYSHLVSSRVGARANIGPFARLRGAVIENDCRVGDYVEIKASTLHSGAKAAHLTYIGDAEVGEGTNVGCGTVFCNYDGKDKHRTVVGKNCFIGANVNLVAPLKVGDNAFIAAGTTVTRDLEDDSFTIGRVRQESKKKDKPQ